VSIAQDALFSVDGIEATRPSNEVSDIVPGVTLNLRAASEKPVKLKVEPDREAAQDAVIKLVGGYNRLVAQINILTRADEAIIGEIDYFTDEERKAAKERLGLLLGDSTLSLLKSSLQRSMTATYETRDGSAMTLLSQLGVASDARAPGSVQGYDKTKMRGYLEIDEDTLKKALNERFEAVKELFGYDTDGDLIVNSGVAYALDTTLKPYVETGGIVSLKTGTLDAQRAREKTGIETMDRQLAAKEEELKRKYGQMEGALNRMEGTAGSIENFNNQNKN
jgi:flagellar hook-associated protein 2